jgi:hypothetical protein
MIQASPVQDKPVKLAALPGARQAFGHPQPNCILTDDGYNYGTTHPLQGHSVDFCLGRKNRLLGGFFISRPRKVL